MPTAGWRAEALAVQLGAGDGHDGDDGSAAHGGGIEHEHGLLMLQARDIKDEETRLLDHRIQFSK